MEQKDIQRLYRRIKIGAANECWPWMTTQRESEQRWNYGRFYIGQRVFLAHRLVLEVKLGRPIQRGMVAMHSCDNPQCCNPNHLAEGTQRDNALQRTDRGRNNSSRQGRRDAGEPVVRLLQKIDMRGEAECWPWQGAVKQSGRGSLRVFGREVYASRLMLEIKIERPLERSERACHSCDNPNCCNPSHISVGSQAENLRQAMVRQRFPAGEDHHMTKLTKAKVIHLRSRFAAETITCKQLAVEEGIDQVALGYILHGETWKYVGGPIARRRGPRSGIRFNKEIAEEIRRRFAAGGVTRMDLAREYGTHKSAITHLVVGRTWKDAGGPIAEIRPPVVMGSVRARRLREAFAAHAVTMTELAKQEGISLTAVHHLLHGHTWKDAGGPILRAAR